MQKTQETPAGELIERTAAILACQRIMDEWMSMMQPHPALGAKDCRAAIRALPAVPARGRVPDRIMTAINALSGLTDQHRWWSQGMTIGPGLILRGSGRWQKNNEGTDHGTDEHDWAGRGVEQIGTPEEPQDWD